MRSMRKQQKYRRVVLTESVLRTIRAETSRYRLRETGGVLVGYVDAQFSVVVTAVCGPGPRSERTLHHVLIDGAAASAFCERWRHRTGGKIDYLGDWHSHISFSTEPSSTDIEAMQTMKHHTRHRLFAPVSLIVARFNLRYAVFVLSRERLTSIRSEVVPDNFMKPSWLEQ
jgi:integrative and conjugative element protein (TIGR02256 family)